MDVQLLNIIIAGTIIFALYVALKNSKNDEGKDVYMLNNRFYSYKTNRPCHINNSDYFHNRHATLTDSKTGKVIKDYTEEGVFFYNIWAKTQKISLTFKIFHAYDNQGRVTACGIFPYDSSKRLFYRYRCNSCLDDYRKEYFTEQEGQDIKWLNILKEEKVSKEEYNTVFDIYNINATAGISTLRLRLWLEDYKKGII